MDAASPVDSRGAAASRPAAGIASVRFVVLPLLVTGGNIPSHAALAAMVHREVLWLSGVVHPPFGGLYQINISVPIGRQPDGVNLTYEEFRSIVRS